MITLFSNYYYFLYLFSTLFEQKKSVYNDVLPAFLRWRSEGKKIYVYSSGSVAAQKMLFKYSTEGDLLKFFHGHFDTTVGSKMDVNSYLAILKLIDEEGKNCLFLTDLLKGKTGIGKDLKIILV